MITLSGDSPILLPEGHYWLELDFERPISKEVLLQALRQMGFDRIVLEPENVSFGAASSSFSPSAAVSPLRASTLASSALQSTAASMAIPQTAPAPVASAIRPSATTSSAVATAATPIAASRAPTAPTAPSGPSSRQPASVATQATSRPVAATPAAQAPAAPPKKGGGFLGPDQIPPEGRPAPLSAPMQEAPAEAATAAASSAPSATSAPGGGRDFPEEAPAPIALEASPAQSLASVEPDPAFRVAPAPPGAEVKKTSILPWALAAGAAVAAIALFAGEQEPNPYAFKLTARLARPIAARNLPGLWWKSIHRLAIDPTEAVVYTIVPFQLTSGVTYDLRFMSRDKSGTTRASVLALMKTMGFSPCDALLVRRNVRIPGRPGTTLSEWLGVATWTGPNSYTTIEDPLLFVGVVPVEG